MLQPSRSDDVVTCVVDPLKQFDDAAALLVQSHNIVELVTDLQPSARVIAIRAM